MSDSLNEFIDAVIVDMFKDYTNGESGDAYSCARQAIDAEIKALQETKDK